MARQICPAIHSSGAPQAGRARIGRPALLLLLCAASGLAHANTAPDFSDLSLEELADIQVTSVSKMEQSLSRAPASIYVITAEDIRRSGATSLPEALRLAPQLQVARVDARNYAITARGFNNPFENKLQVLIDGRIVYSPLFSGVFWDAQDVVLEDIDRIEVISGAAATLWGTNAVNGVINIITRSARDTQGALADATVGSGLNRGSVRYGGKLSGDGYFRVYGKHAEEDDTQRVSGVDAADGWRRDQGGFRADWGGRRDRLTLQGDAYQGSLHQLGTRDIRIGGANLLGRIQRSSGANSDVSLQAYLDHTERDQPGAFVEYLDTADLELQRTLRLGSAQRLVVGGGYRLAHDRVRNDVNFAFLPGSVDLHWADVFAQDEIALRKQLKLTLGLRLENNSYTGTETMPALRLAWTPDDHRLLWTSLSRAVRTPSRIDRDFYAPTNPPLKNGVPQYFLAGGPDFQSEVVNAFEIGYRAQPSTRLSYSLTAFYDDYDRLRTLEQNPAGPGLVFLNMAEGEVHGVESWANWQATPAWRLSAGLVVQKLQLRKRPGSLNSAAGSSLANNDPNHYWSLRSTYDIDDRRQLDLFLRRVGDLPMPAVPAYTSLDLRFGWRLTPRVELSLIGQNLWEPHHVEFGSAPGRSEYDRALLLRVVWRI